MRTSIFIGVMLISIGISAVAYQEITLATRERVVDLGPSQMTHGVTRGFPLIIGGIALVGGVVLLVRGNKKGWWERG